MVNEVRKFLLFTCCTTLVVGSACNSALENSRMNSRIGGNQPRGNSSITGMNTPGNTSTRSSIYEETALTNPVGPNKISKCAKIGIGVACVLGGAALVMDGLLAHWLVKEKETNTSLDNQISSAVAGAYNQGIKITCIDDSCVFQNCTQLYSGCKTCNSNGCTMCSVGTFLSKNSCSPCSSLIPNCLACNATTGTKVQCSSCTVGSIPNYQGTTCSSCSSLIGNCGTCISSGSSNICTSCVNNLCLSQNSCQPCSTSCTSFGSQCSTCTTNLCSSCATGFILTSNSMSCASCATAIANCLSCSASGAGTNAYSAQCLSCSTGFVLSGSTSCQSCATAIPNCSSCSSNNGVVICTMCGGGLFPSLTGTSCVACSTLIANCQSCSSSGSALSCSTCVSGYTTAQGGTSCVANTNNVAPSGTTTISGNANSCPSTGNVVSPSVCPTWYNVGCTTCDDNGCLSCNVGTAACTSCTIANCNSCCLLAPVSCLSCNTGYSLTSSGTCASCSGISNCQTCSLVNGISTCTACNSGFGLSSSGNSCISCSSISNCINCTISGGSASCTACNAGFAISSTGASCLSCSTISNCSSCLYTNSALTCQSCNNGFGLSSSGTSCISCSSISNCNTCSAGGSGVVCASCNAGFCLNNGNCQACSTNYKVGYLNNAGLPNANEYVKISDAVKAGYNVVPLAFVQLTAVQNSVAPVSFVQGIFIAYNGFNAITSCTIQSMAQDIALARTLGLKYVTLTIGGASGDNTYNVDGSVAPSVVAQALQQFCSSLTCDGFDFDLEISFNGSYFSQLVSAIKSLNSSYIISIAPQSNGCGSNALPTLVSTGCSTDYNQAISSGAINYIFIQDYCTGGYGAPYNGGSYSELSTMFPAAIYNFLTSSQTTLSIPSSTFIVVGIPATSAAGGCAGTAFANSSYYNTAGSQTFNPNSPSSYYYAPVYTGYSTSFNLLNGASQYGGIGAWSVNQDVFTDCPVGIYLFGLQASACPNSTANTATMC